MHVHVTLKNVDINKPGAGRRQVRDRTL